MLDRTQWTTMGVLCTGGGIVYILPYLRYTYYDLSLQALGLNHTQFGNLVSVYGSLNIVFYFLGGLVADRVAARNLVGGSLVGAGLAGLYYSTFPGYRGAMLVCVVWSATTVLLYWAAMMKAVKLLVGDSEQGKVFGLRESGFAGFALIYTMSSVPVFRAFGEGVPGFRAVVIYYSAINIVAGVASYLYLPRESPEAEAVTLKTSLLEGIGYVIRMPSVWLAAVVIFCAYAIHVGMGFLNPYATNVYGMSDATAAVFGAVRTYGMGLFGGLLGGYLAYRLRSAAKYMFATFVVLAVILMGLKVVPSDPALLAVMVTFALTFAIADYAMRGVYYVSVGDMRLPDEHIGFTIGFLSFVGYLPDAFINTYFGSLLDASATDPSAGYMNIFTVMLWLAALGALCALLLLHATKRRRRRLEG